MLKKIGLSAVLAAMLILAVPPQASARVRFGVAIGGPVYTYPVDPYAYPYNYQAPYAYQGDPYLYPAVPYAYPTPGYVSPSLSFGWGGHGWDRDHHEFREDVERGRVHEFRGGSEHFHGRR
ncbi:MAG TPA: hypothetical protein VKU19_22745 [Bryobacteraceae bacterium]|nr:hypothetical protein [Bryobacteraceae bacterium]